MDGAVDQSDTPLNHEEELAPTPLHLMHLPLQRPGPELNSSEIMVQGLHTNIECPAININNMPRTSEPDNDDCCIQPERLRKLMIKQQDSIREVGDSSTIFSARTGTDTMDTDTTIQRGSRSKKPSPDPDSQPQPVVRKNHGSLRNIPGAIEQASGYEHRHEGMPSSLSFPSPPSVDDEELPTHHQQASSSANASVVSAQDKSSESLSSSSKQAESSHRRSSGKTKGMTSSRKRFYIVVVALIVLVVVVAVSMNATKKNDPSKKQSLKHHDLGDNRHQSGDDDSGDVPKTSPSTVTTPPSATSLVAITTIAPSASPHLDSTSEHLSPAPATFDGPPYQDEIIVLASANLSNQTVEVNHGNETIPWQDESSSEAPSVLVLPEIEEDTLPPTDEREHSQLPSPSAPTQPPAPSSLLRGAQLFD